MEDTNGSEEGTPLARLEEVRQQLTELMGFRALPRPLLQAETAVDRVTLYIMMRNTKRTL